MAITKFAIRHKRLVSVLLIFCVVFFNIYAMQQTAHAFVIEALVGICIAFAATALLAWGVSFLTPQAAQQAAEAITFDTTYDTNSDGMNDYIVDAATTGQAVYDVATGAYQWVSRIADEDLQWWRDYIHSHYTAGENYETENTDTGLSYDNLVEIYNGNTASGSVRVTFSYNGVNQYNEFVIDPVNGRVYFYRYDGGFDTTPYYSTYQTFVTGSNLYVNTHYNPSNQYNYVYIQYSTGSSVIYQDYSPFYSDFSCTINSDNEIDTGVYVDPDIYNDNTYTPTNSKTGEPDIPCDVYPAPGDMTGDITLADGTGLVVDQEQTISDVVGKTADDVLTKDIVGVPELVDTVAIPADTAVDDAQTAEDAMAADETQTSLKGLFISKFPFCIPWDLANAFKLIAAPAEAPHFEIDFLAPLDDTIHFQGSTEIDFDMADYPLIGQVCRWCFTIEFCIALMLATRKAMKW